MTDRLTRNLPIWQFWLGVVLSVAVTLLGAAYGYGQFQGKVDAVERRVTTIETDRKDVLADWNEWREGITKDVATIKSDTSWLRSTYEQKQRRD